MAIQFEPQLPASFPASKPFNFSIDNLEFF